MWGQKNAQFESENILKESLLRQLSQTVKAVQLHYSQTKEVCKTQEVTSSLISVLEAMFLHALKRTLLESAKRSMTVTEDAKPTPSFYEAVKTITHKDTLKQIAALPQVNNDVGRSRAWIRLALNDAAVPSYLAAITGDRRLARFYRPVAFLRDKETLDTASRLLDGLLPVPFDVPTNSSLLNIWDSEPLLASGLWSPALRPTVQVAVDVACGMEEEETYSELTTSSSLRSLITLDETQALQIILETHQSIEAEEIAEEEHEEEVEPMKKDDDLDDRMQRSYSYLLESCSPKIDAPVLETDVNIIVEDLRTSREELYTESSHTEDDISRPAPLRRKYEEDFETLISHAEESASERHKLEEKWKENNEERRNEKHYETIVNMADVIQKIPREVGLQAQRFECADCRLSIGLNFGSALLCNVTGEYLCENCHMSEVGVVPARIIYNWDYNKYPTGKKAAKYVHSVLSEPLFDLEKLNPKLFKVVKELQEIRQLRRQLKLLNFYLTTCKEPINLSARSYLLENSNCFSLSDLISVPGGSFKAELSKLVNQARNHVIGCWMCSQKGFICEICRDPQVIYPFDAGSVYRCTKCKAVYHGNCLSSGKLCPKCRRRKKREATSAE